MTNLHGSASLAALLATTALSALLLAPQGARAQNAYAPGNLLVSKSILNAPASLLVPGQAVLPGGGGATAVGDGLFGNVFKNEVPDLRFGVTTGSRSTTRRAAAASAAARRCRAWWRASAAKASWG